MKVRKAKGLAAAALSGGLLFGTACLPEDYWVALAGDITTGLVTSVVDDVINQATDAILPGTTEE